MGRHSSGTANRKPAKGLIFGIIALLAVIALIIWLVARDSSSDDAEHASDQCGSETTELHVATTDPASAAQLIKNFNSQAVQTADDCDVKAHLVDQLADADVLLTSYTDEQVDQVLTAAQRTADRDAAEWPVALYVPVGVAHAAGAEALADPAAISYPVATDARSAALVAAYTTGNDPVATAALLEGDSGLQIADIPANTLYAADANEAEAASDDADTNTETTAAEAEDSDAQESEDAEDAEDAAASEASEENSEENNEAADEQGSSFYAIPGLFKQLRVVTLEGEATHPAAQAFQDYYIDEAVAAPENLITQEFDRIADAAMPLNLQRWQAAAPAESATPADDQDGKENKDDEASENDSDADSKEEEQDAALALSHNTLFLVDTSDAMTGQWMDTSRTVVSNAANAVAGAGGEVALWNYSSPLTGARPMGWRDNEAFGAPADSIAQRMAILGTGGQPQTHEALNAAAPVAKEHNARIVLITSGSVDNAALQLDGVPVTVIHVGSEDTVDPAVQDAATTFTVVSDPTELGNAVNAAIGA